VEGFLQPSYATEKNVGVVYLLSGSSHLYDQASRIAESTGADQDRMHAVYLTRALTDSETEHLEDYKKQIAELLSQYDELIIVDTGFRGTMAKKLAEDLRQHPDAPATIRSRLLFLNEGIIEGDLVGFNQILACTQKGIGVEIS